MKKNNILYIFVIITLCFNLVSSVIYKAESTSYIVNQASYDVGEDGKIVLRYLAPKDGYGSLYPSDYNYLKTTIPPLVSLSAQYLREMGYNTGKITIDKHSAVIVEATADGKSKIILKIPSGVSLEKKDNDWVLKGKPFPLTTDEVSLEIEGVRIFGKRAEGSESHQIEEFNLILSRDKSGIRTIKIDKKAEISIGETNFPGIEKATIRLDKDNNIIFADFISIVAGKYTFSYKNIKFNFNVGEGSHIIFDPLGGVISGDKGELSIESTGNEEIRIRATNKFILTLDSSGNFMSLELSKGDKILVGDNGNFYTNKESMKVFFDGRSLENYNDGNAISISKNMKNIEIRGFVLADISGVRYEGLGENTYTKLEIDSTKGKPDSSPKPYFDIVKGDASIENNNHKILLIGGEAKLKIKKIISDGTGDFGFSYITKDGFKIDGFLYESLIKDGKKGLFEIIVHKTDKESFVVTRSFSDIDKSFEERTLYDFIGEELNIQKREANIRNELVILNQQIDDLKKKLGTATSPELDRLELQRVIAENALGKIQGKDINFFIDNLREYLRTARSIESRTSAEYMLAEYLIQKASTFDINHVYSFKTKEIENINTNAPSVKVTTVYLRIDKNGIVTGYSFNGRNFYSLDLNPENVYGVSGISQEQVDLIKALRDNGWDTEAYIESKKDSLGSYSDLAFSSSLTDLGVATMSYEYNQASELRNEAEKLFISSQENERLRPAALLSIAGSYRVLGDNARSISEYEKIANSNYDDDVKSEANRLAAMLAFSTSPRENAIYALERLSSAISLNKDNFEARRNLALVQDLMLNDRLQLYRLEPGFLMDDLNRIFGEGGRWEKVNLGIVDVYPGNFFNSVTAWYYQLTGKGEEYTTEQIRRLVDNDMRILAAQTMRSLISSGIDMSSYFSGDLTKKYELIALSHGLDRGVSITEIQRYLDNVPFSNDPKEFKSQMDRLYQRISIEKGSSIADSYMADARLILSRVAALDYAIRRNRDLYLIAANGGTLSGIDMPLEGSERIEDTFKTTRAGQPITANIFEEYGLPVLDFGVNFVGLYGIGRYASMIGKATLGKYFTGISKFINPGEALALKTLGAESSNLGKLLIALPTDVGAQIGLINLASKIHPGLATVMEIMTVLVPGGNSANGIRIGALKSSGKEVEFLMSVESSDLSRTIKILEERGFVGRSKGVFVNAEKNSIIYLVEEGGELPTELIEKGAKTTRLFRIDELISERSENLRAIQEYLGKNNPGTTISRTTEAVTSGCFLANTKILMQDGSYKNIQDILVGDKITAFDIYNNKPTNAEVTTTFIRNATEYLIIEYEIKD